MKKVCIIIYFFSITISSFSQNEASFTMEDRERLIRLEEQVKKNTEKIEELKHLMNARFEAVDAKFEAQNEKFIAQNEKLDILFTLIYFVLGGIIGLIGFVLWDRRTFLKPFKDKNEELMKKNEKLEKALKDYANKNKELADILRIHGLL